MNKQDLQFQIDQLRKDKIIYAAEATATSVTAVLGVFLSTFWEYGVYFIVLVPVAIFFWMYVMISNHFRLQKIKKLESQF